MAIHIIMPYIHTHGNEPCCASLTLCSSCFWVVDGDVPDWPKVDAETLKHFTALIQIDTTNPPGNETKAVEYVAKVLEAEGIPVKNLPNSLTALMWLHNFKGNGPSGHCLSSSYRHGAIDPKKWTHPPFSADREVGYLYGHWLRSTTRTITLHA